MLNLRWSLPRVALDFGLWTLLAAAALWLDHAGATVLAAVLIGAVPLHDILFHGHEATHRLAARSRVLNEGLLWLSHALVGISGTAYRAFHLEHHRHTHTQRDPEVELLSALTGRPSGWAYLLLPVLSYTHVNTWPMRRPSPHASARSVARDLALAALLHLGLANLLGTATWLTFVVLPAFTGLAAVVVVRSLCEHHGAVPGSRWTRTRTIYASRLVELAWSNANHHLEHHLAPSVPWHRLPALRAELEDTYGAHGAVVDRGFLATSLRLLRTPEHFGQPTAGRAA